MLKGIFSFIGLTVFCANAWAQEKTLVFLGDSLTAGFGLAEDASFPSQIEERLKAEGMGWKVVNAGVSGDTTSGGLKRLPWVMKSKPDAVFVALGSNDGLRGLDPAVSKANLENIVRSLKKSGVRVILAGAQLPVNYGGDYRDAFSKIYPALAKREKVPLYPFLLEGVAMNPRMNLPDGLHPNEEGQKVIAENVFKFLKPILWQK